MEEGVDGLGVLEQEEEEEEFIQNRTRAEEEFIQNRAHARGVIPSEMRPKLAVCPALLTR